ncbi:MAG: hypothetical protein ABSB19_09300 [Methylomonas sp.]|jgi:hypothetical protein
MVELFEFEQLAGRLKSYTEMQGLRPEEFLILHRNSCKAKCPVAKLSGLPV